MLKDLLSMIKNFFLLIEAVIMYIVKSIWSEIKDRKK